jgi:hypothetical protein
MPRLSRSACLAAVITLAGTFSVAQTPLISVDKKDVAGHGKTVRDRMRETQRKLSVTVDFAGVDDPKATLDSVLKDLAKRNELVFEVNEKAFQFAGLRDVRATHLVYDDYPLPPLKAVSVAYVLQKVLDHVPNTFATYINRGHCIEITTKEARDSEVSPDPDRGPKFPVVTADFAKQPLEDALKKLSNVTGYNIVLDARAGDKARAQITADLADVPLDTAVRILADMSDLKAVLLDNVLYVTAKENAENLQSEYRQRRINAKETSEEEEAVKGFLTRVMFFAGWVLDEKEIAKFIEKTKKEAQRAERNAQTEALKAQILKLQAQIAELELEKRK